MDSPLITDWGTELSLLFSPKCPKLESLVDKMKEAMDSSEVRRRLPKVPKRKHHLNFARLRRKASFLEYVIPKTQRKKKRRRVIRGKVCKGDWAKGRRHNIFSGLWKTPKNRTHHKFIITSMRSNQNGMLEMIVFQNNIEMKSRG